MRGMEFEETAQLREEGQEEIRIFECRTHILFRALQETKEPGMGGFKERRPHKKED